MREEGSSEVEEEEKGRREERGAVGIEVESKWRGEGEWRRGGVSSG